MQNASLRIHRVVLGQGDNIMSPGKRIAVTLPAGPKIEHTISRIRWAEERGMPDAWFSDSGAPDSLTQVAAVAHYTESL